MIAESMYLIKAGSLLLFLLLLPDQSQAMDNCRARTAWKCGGQCIGAHAECLCGGTNFGAGDKKWCCTEDEEECEGIGHYSKGYEVWRGELDKEGRKDKYGNVIEIGANCSRGEVRNLTETCHGRCNYFPDDPSRNYGDERSFRQCDATEQGIKTTQCIREGEWMDGKYDCNNRARLRRWSIYDSDAMPMLFM